MSTIDKDIIHEQIEKVRDLDSETSKPRLKPGKPEKTVKRTPAPKEKKEPNTSQLFTILTPYLRTPLTGKPEPPSSTYTPCAYNMYTIIHYMDDLMRKSFYFKRQEDAWHPFISRIYFGTLFYIQTLRAELKTGTIASRHRRFLVKFLTDYPPETLTVPGPLVATFESLNAAKPSNKLYGTVTPAIYPLVGRLTASNLIIANEGNAYHIALPYIPGLIGFAQLIITADPNAVPDFTQPQSFSTARDATLNGHVFRREAWTPLERAALLQPGMLYRPETNRDIDLSFNTYGKRLNIPNFAADASISHLDEFLGLDRDNTWFGNINQIMSTYSSYFVGNTTLADCSLQQTTAPLVINELIKSSTPDTAANPLFTLTHAFPAEGVFTTEYQHKSNNAIIAVLLLH